MYPAGRQPASLDRTARAEDLELMARWCVDNPLLRPNGREAWLLQQMSRWSQLMRLMGLEGYQGVPTPANQQPGQPDLSLASRRWMFLDQVCRGHHLHMAKGFLYLVAIMDCGTFWPGSLQHHGHQLLRALEEALGKGRPRYSTPTKGVSSPVRPLPRRCAEGPGQRLVSRYLDNIFVERPGAQVRGGVS